MTRDPFPTNLSLGFSPCPNDTFIFHALTHGLVQTPFRITERLEDVETLNRLVLGQKLNVSKVSYHLFGHVREHYCLLRSGGALGRGCGPLLVSAAKVDPAALRNRPIAVPGEFTTAALLLRLFDPSLASLVFMPFHEIPGRVVSGECSAGVIIHESRFTYEEMSLVKLLDLGEWWENSTGYPIPLGGIVAQRSLGGATVVEIERAIADSVASARANPEVARGYVREHAREMSDEVCSAHIGLYVNDFSLDLGEEGTKAVQYLFSRAEDAGILPRSGHGIFME